MGIMDNTIGVMLAASWLNAGLYTIELIRMREFFMKQSGFNYTMVALGVLLASDTLVTFAIMILMYLFTVTHWGEVAYLQVQPWPFTACMIGTSTTAAIVQTFLSWKLYRLTKSWLLFIFLCACSVVAVGGAVASAIIINRFTGLSSRETLHSSLTVWLSTSAGADILIAIGLVYQLWKVRKTTRGFSQSLLAAKVERIIIQSIETGTVTSTVALVSLITYLLHPFWNYGPSFSFILGRVYTLNMLLVLLRGSSSSLASERNPSDLIIRGTFGSTQKVSQGINVDTTVLTQVDERIPMDSFSHSRATTAVELPHHAGLSVEYEEKEGHHHGF